MTPAFIKATDWKIRSGLHKINLIADWQRETWNPVNYTEDLKNKGLKITLHCMSKQSNSRQRQGFHFVSSALYWHASHVVLVAPPRKSMAETEREERVSKCRRLVTDPCLLMDKEQYALHYAGNKTHHKYNVDTFSWLTCSKLRRYEYTQQKLTDI